MKKFILLLVISSSIIFAQSKDTTAVDKEIEMIKTEYQHNEETIKQLQDRQIFLRGYYFGLSKSKDTTSVKAKKSDTLLTPKVTP